MAQYRVAKRYAKGLMQFLSNDTDKEKHIVGEMKQITKLLDSNRDLKNFFNSPILDYKKKTSVTKEVFSSFSEETITFLSLIIKQGRSEAIGAIAKEFINQYGIKHNIKKATIISAQELEPSQLETIVKKVKEILPENTTIEVESKINKELVGGFVLRIDDKQIDASLKTRLQNIKKEFDSKHYIPKV